MKLIKIWQVFVVQNVGRQEGEQADLLVRGLLHVPLVPRHGEGVVRKGRCKTLKILSH